MSIRKRSVVAYFRVLNLTLTGKEGATLGVLIQNSEDDMRNWYV